MIEFNTEMTNKQLTEYIKSCGFKTKTHFAEVAYIPMSTLNKWGTLRSDSNKKTTAKVPAYVKAFCEAYRKIYQLEEENKNLKNRLRGSQ